MASVAIACLGLSRASEASKLALLHRRAVRLGLVEEFRRVRGDETVRRVWDGTQNEESDKENGTSFQFLGEYGRVDEKFEEALARTARVKVERFEAVGRDGVVLWVEGRPVRRIFERPVWEVLADGR